MQIQQGSFCPLVQGECKKFECAFFTQVRGKNPNNAVDRRRSTVKANRCSG